MSSSARPQRAVPLALAALLLLGACTPDAGDAGDDPLVDPSEPSSVGESSASQEGGSESGGEPSGGDSSSSGGSSSGPDPDLTPLEQHQRIGFLMPSQNVACLIEEQGVSCDIRNTHYQHTVVPAAKCVEPTVELYRDRPEWTCSRSSRFVDAQTENDGAWVEIVPRGEVVKINTIDHTVLPYGEKVEAFDFQCESRPSGVRCTRLSDGRGFRMAVQDYDLF
ncbi:hypothetical protein [Kytococcus sedentarius]|uniref:hypothetical protein n=1 Tax=Kytococcus sedentarius TaxID=1276 RepID=UPI0035BBFC91